MMFSPRLRSRATLTVAREGEWQIHRQIGLDPLTEKPVRALYRLTLDRSRPPGKQIAWGVCVRHKWVRKGEAGTVYDALREMS